MADIIMSIFGALSSLLILPTIARIWKRKSATDFSYPSILLGIFVQTVWLIYSIMEIIIPMIVAGICWEILLIIQMLLVFKYHE